MDRSEWTAGDENVARLLRQPYDPPSASADFAERVQASLQEVAAEMARKRMAPPRRARHQQRWAALAGVAAMLGIAALGLRWLPHSLSPSVPVPTSAEQRLATSNPAAPSLAPGAQIATGRGERRRVALPDGSMLSLNENTVVRHDALRHLTLKAGEIFVEVASRWAGEAVSLFTVATPHREVRATGTKFLVRADADGTGVAVTQGQVHVSDCDGLLSSGQQLASKTNTITPTPRLSYLLDWTRDLVVSAAPSLVPPSPHSGGALVASDPQGNAAHLSLRKYHIDVHIEDGFARTTIDQTYFNHTLSRLEGTFFFPLPADASLSRLAMYVDGTLMEGGMVERDYGRMVFDQIVTKMKDPALLEWVDGHTFKMRVFPLEPRQEKRIILSYTQRLPYLYGRLSYRFPAGHSLGAVRDWSLHVRVKDGAKLPWRCDSHSLTRSTDNNDLLLDASGKQITMERDLVLDLMEAFDSEAMRFSTATQDGYRYLMLRYRPNLPGTTTRQRRDWVFLFESSAERDPLLARAQVEIVRTLLTNAERDDTFAILAAGTQTHAFAPLPLAATPENVAAALAFLEKTHLLGALDLGAGLTAAAELLTHREHPVLVHLGCGRAVLGERRADALVERIPRRACYVGVGVDKRGASDFMRRAAQRCQGYVTEIRPDEAVAWRAFDLLGALNTPRLADVCIDDPQGKAPFLCPTSIVAQGEELCAIARFPVNVPLPQLLCVTGMLDGQPFREELHVESPRPDAAYLPRTWARLEIDRLLAEDAVKNKNAIIELSKAMYVMTPYTSLLVLENEAMYAQYKVDRGRKDHWAMYPCPPKIPVVIERPTGNEVPYKIELEPPSIYTWSLSVESDAQLQERIRQENRERKGGAPTQWMMNPYQGYLQGTAEVTRAGAAYHLPLQQARLLRQEAIRSSVQTRRSMIEEAEWERARMPDVEKIRQQTLQRELGRLRSSPALTDVWSARSLNALLQHLIAQDKQVVHGPNLPLSEDTLRHVNLSIGTGGGNIGLLKSDGKLEWPAALQRELFRIDRDKLSEQMRMAIQSVRSNGKPEDATLDDLQNRLRNMNSKLNSNLDSLMPEEYIEANRYLRSIKQAVGALKSPNLARFFDDTKKLEARNVAELVRFMRDNKLEFAPATPRDEAAYVALYQALAAYDAGRLHASSNSVQRATNAPAAYDVGGPRTNSNLAPFDANSASALGGRSSGSSWTNQFAGRSAGTRTRLLSERGGNAVSEAAVARGLEWLAHHQADDGHWSAHDFIHHARNKTLPGGKEFICDCQHVSAKENTILATAAGVLPFLAVGITPQPSHRSPQDYAPAVAAALRYLREHQKQDGSWEGGLSAQAFATTALCEAFALSSDPPLWQAAQRGLNYLASIQDKDSGGWGDTPGGELFTTGWAFLALKSGQMAGLRVPRTTLKQAAHFLDACETSEPGNYADRPGGSATPLFSAVALLCRQYSGIGPKNRGLRSGVERFKTLPPDITTDVEYLFFATQVIHNLGGAAWTFWNLGPSSDGKGGMRNVLIARQDKGDTPQHSHQSGSWAAEASSRLQGGRVVATALSLLCLEVYYRHLPIYRRDDSTMEFNSVLHGQQLEVPALPTLEIDVQISHAAGADAEGTEQLLTGLLADPVQAKQSSVWRQAARSAEQRRQYETAWQRLCRALVLDRNRPRDLPSLRRDFAWFLNLSEQRVLELAAQRRSVPRELLDWVMAIADQWRAVDAEDWRPCWLAGRLLSLAGQRELAWGYLTSPSILQHGDGRRWLELARQQYWQEEYDFAERAYAVAASLEPGNAEVVWERALNHRAAGHDDAARALLHQLDKGKWPEDQRDFPFRARRALEQGRD